MSLPLFVYGTLKHSAAGTPHALLRDAEGAEAASISGELYDLGDYPGVYRTAASVRRVFGELFTLSEATADSSLRALDRYEGREFVRKRVYVTLRDGSRRIAWAYLLRSRPSEVLPLRSGRYQPKRHAAG